MVGSLRTWKNILVYLVWLSVRQSCLVIIYTSFFIACIFRFVHSGFPRLIESPGFYFLKTPGPGKSWKITLVLVIKA